jgi:uncharacterized damage-inducible protein DinB
MGSDDRTPDAPRQGEDDSTPQELIERYLAGPALVRDTVAGMDASQLAARPIAGKMSTKEVVSHIADSEQFYTGRMKRTIAGDEPLVMGARPPDRPVPSDQAERDTAQDLDRLQKTREEMAEELRQITPDVWQRVAMQREDSLVTLRQLLQRTALHLETHVEAIAEKRAALGL